jgi:hypothetical protein
MQLRTGKPHTQKPHVYHATGPRGGPFLPLRRVSGCSLSQEQRLVCSSC